jgi:hypothetical protein
VGYLGVGVLLLAVVAGVGGSHGKGSATPSPTPPPAPASVSASPVLTQVTSDQWTAAIYLNSAVLCPAVPSFELVTTGPDHDIGPSGVKYQTPAGSTFTPRPGCKASSLPAKPLVYVQLTFGPSSELAGSPVAADVVVTPAQPTAAPVQIAVAVHRRVTSWEYAWVPLLCGSGLALAFVLFILLTGLQNPDHTEQGRKDRMYGARFWNRPLYAAAAWTFGGSLATNITTAGAVVATVLTASGTLSELFPGVELGRFSLLIAAAGGVTAVAPLVFAALNYRFAQVDPTTANVSVLTLPPGPVAVLHGRLIPPFRRGGILVALTDDTEIRPRGSSAARKLTAPDSPMPGSNVTIMSRVTMLADGKPVGKVRAILPDSGKSLTDATITVLAGATITLPGGASIARDGQATDITPLPGTRDAELKPGITLSVPPGATITVSAADPELKKPALALPSGSDIAVTAGQRLSVNATLTMAAEDVTMQDKPDKPGLTTREEFPITVKGGAKITFLGRARLWLPAGTCVAAPGADQDHPAKSSYLTVSTTFPLPHTSQVIAGRMWSLLFASCLTLLGTGAELGILGVLALGLAAADFTIRVLCVITITAVGLVVCVYGVTSIRALADPTPGDALNATPGTAFML